MCDLEVLETSNQLINVILMYSDVFLISEMTKLHNRHIGHIKLVTQF